MGAFILQHAVHQPDGAQCALYAAARHIGAVGVPLKEIEIARLKVCFRFDDTAYQIFRYPIIF